MGLIVRRYQWIILGIIGLMSTVLLIKKEFFPLPRPDIPFNNTANATYLSAKAQMHRLDLPAYSVRNKE